MHLFETKRLLVRLLSLNDLQVMTKILSDPDVMRHSVRGVCDEKATREFIEWCIACYKTHGVGPWALTEKTNGDLIGFCGLSPEVVKDTEEINLGYRLSKKYWGQQLATEAAKAVVDYGFNQKQVDSIIVIIEPAHIASLRVAEKCGFNDFTATTYHDKSVRIYRLNRKR
ncbi:MAG: GNAT family N-acetyltransferase [Endozoicomonas sp.]